ncbi:PGN_0703 family putative restriction endonuclease [Geodermatophilus sp. SYSU D00965]
MTARDHSYRDRCRVQAAAWKATTPSLPEEARRPARWLSGAGVEVGPPVPFCLPATSAELNLLPHVRDGALALFRELDIPWHMGARGGPGNHLLSSQVQCVNALFPMVTDADRLVRAFGTVLDIAEVLEIEPGRRLTFEYIGDEDVLGESPGRPRRRGTMATSCDAAFLYKTSTGRSELALVEWKYTEDYREPRTPHPRSDATRRRRYAHLVAAPDGPLDGSVLDFDDLLDEPFYQLMRQQLFASELEKRRAQGAEVVRIVHVLPPANDAYQASLTRPAHRADGTTVSEVWQRLLRHPDRFISLDPAVFTDASVTTDEYCARYGETAPPHHEEIA